MQGKQLKKSALVKYYQQQISSVTNNRRWYRTENSDWWTVHEEANRVGRDRVSVKASIRKGRPTHIRSTAFLVQGGTLDGQWCIVNEIAEATGFGRRFIASCCDDRTGIYTYREPAKATRRVKEWVRQRPYKPRYRSGQNITENGAATAFTSLRIAV